jgi:cystathionine beta-lyase
VAVISDEIHMDMVWGEHRHTPWNEVALGKWALLTSGSKSFNIPALTGAYGLIGDNDSRNAYLSALKGRDGLSSPSVLALTAHIAAYEQGAPWLDALRRYLEENLHYVARELNSAFPNLNWQPPQATYLAWIDLSPLGIDDKALQKVLIEQQKVAIMPGYTYGEEGNGFVRLNAGCPRSKLEQGVQRLIAGINTLR